MLAYLNVKNIKYKKAIIYSVVSGCLFGLSLNTVGGIPLSPLEWFGMVPFLLVLRTTNNFFKYMISGFLFCLSFLIIGMFAFLPAYFVGGAALIIVGAIHLMFPLFILYFFQKRIGWRKALWILPLLWPVWEWFFLQSKLSLPLMAIYLGQTQMTWLIQYIDIFGYNAISMWIILLNVLIALAIDEWLKIIAKPRRKRKQLKENWKDKYVVSFLVKRLATVLAIMFIPPLLYGAYINATLQSKLNGGITVSLVQSNLSPIAKYTDSVAVANIGVYITMTDSLMKSEQTDLVVWPETAIPLALMKNQSLIKIIFRKVLEWNTPLLTGTADVKYFNDSTSIPQLQKYLNRNYEIYNAAVLITPQLAWKYLKENLDITNLKVYRKQKLMPFTEYVPFSDKYPFFSKLTIDLGDGANFSSGVGPQSLIFASREQELIKVSPIICWDLLYPTNAGGRESDFIAALTNESRLGDIVTTTAYEMEGYTRLRSIETRRSIAKCSTTGFSFFTDPFGRVHGKIPWWSRKASTSNVRLSSINTIFSRYPGYFAYACLIAVVIISAFVFVKSSLLILNHEKKNEYKLSRAK